MSVSELSRGAAVLLPAGWSSVQDLLEAESSEARLLIEAILDRVSVGEVSREAAGLVAGEAEAQAFVCKAEGVALFAIVAERYGIFFGLERQILTFLANTDLGSLAEDLGMSVTRASLPYLLETVKVDTVLRDLGEIRGRVFPLDVLSGIANRARDWYEGSLGAALVRHGRHAAIAYDDLAEQISQELRAAYDRYLLAVEDGVDGDMAMAAVRRIYGVN